MDKVFLVTCESNILKFQRTNAHLLWNCFRMTKWNTYFSKEKEDIFTKFKKFKCIYRPVSKITLSRKCAQLFQIYQPCYFKWHTRKHTSSCIIYTNLNKFLAEKFVVYKLPFLFHFLSFIYTYKWAKDFLQSKVETWVWENA